MIWKICVLIKNALLHQGQVQQINKLHPAHNGDAKELQRIPTESPPMQLFYSQLKVVVQHSLPSASIASNNVCMSMRLLLVNGFAVCSVRNHVRYW